MPAGEEPIEGVDSAALAEGLRARGHRMVSAVADPDELRRDAARPRRRGRHDHLHGRGRHHQMGGGAGRRHLRKREERRNERRSRPSPKVPRQADAATRRWRRSSGSRAAATPNGCSSRPTSTTSPHFLRELDPDVPVMALGLGSNMIVRDGGVPGVVVRLGKAFAKIERLDDATLRCGGGASGILVSSTARDAGIAGLEFLRGIPGTVGGFVRMNGGAYGREVSDILRVVRRSCCARARSRNGRPRRSATPTATASCPKARWSSPRPSAGVPGDPDDDRRRDGPHRRARARNRSRCAAAPAARPSRTRRATRRGR